MGGQATLAFPGSSYTMLSCRDPPSRQMKGESSSKAALLFVMVVVIVVDIRQSATDREA